MANCFRLASFLFLDTGWSVFGRFHRNKLYIIVWIGVGDFAQPSLLSSFHTSLPFGFTLLLFLLTEFFSCSDHIVCYISRGVWIVSSGGSIHNSFPFLIGQTLTSGGLDRSGISCFHPQESFVHRLSSFTVHKIICSWIFYYWYQTSQKDNKR